MCIAQVFYVIKKGFIMNLQELFQVCLAENNNNNVRAAQQFIVKAKKEIPDVKMNDCMKVAGFDEKTKQNFRNNVVIPVRNRIAKIKFELSEQSINRLFGRVSEGQANLTEEEKNTKKSIQEFLPGRTRTAAAKNMDHIDALLVGAEDDAE